MARGDRSPRDEHANRVRNALLNAALNLFSTNGYDETTTDQIAESVGFHRGHSSVTSQPRSRCCSSASTTSSTP